MKILHLTLKKKWFDMILSGQKKEEYRDMKPYWYRRLVYYSEQSGTFIPNSFDVVRFTNGYGNHCPTMEVELKKIDTGNAKYEWAGHTGECFRIHLGKILSTANLPQ